MCVRVCVCHVVTLGKICNFSFYCLLCGKQKTSHTIPSLIEVHLGPSIITDEQSVV